MSTEQIPEVAAEHEAAPAEKITVGLDSLQDTIARLAKTFENAPRRRAADHPTRRYISKFEYLVEQRLISQQDLDAAIAEAKRAQSQVDLILMQEYQISKAQIGQSSSVFYRVPFVEFDDRIVVPPDLIRDLKLEYLKKNYWVPLKREGGAVLVVVDDPHDLAKVDSIERALKNQKVKLAVGFRSDILRFLSVASGEQAPRAGSSESIKDILGTLKAEEDATGTDSHEVAEIDENDSAVVRLANQIIIDAYKARASDIHVEPYGPQKDTMIRLRIDGDCREYQHIPGAYRRALAARLKIMAQLDIAERRKPQDGKIKFRCPTARDRAPRRHASRPQGGNEDVVMRDPRRQRADPHRQAGHHRAQPARVPKRVAAEALRAHPGAWGRPAPARRPRCTRCSATSTAGPEDLDRRGSRSRSRSTACARCRCSPRSASRSRRPCARSCAPTPT